MFKFQMYGFKSEQEFGNEIRRFHDSGMNQKEIAKQIKCSRLTVIKAFKHFDIKARVGILHEKCGFSSDEEMTREFVKLYYFGFSQKDIAEKFSISSLSVFRCFRRHTVKTRSNSESIAILQKDAELYDEIDIINGLLLGNGRLKRKVHTAMLHYACVHVEAINNLLIELKELSPIFNFRRSVNKGWYQIDTLSYMCLAELYDKWYDKDIKILPTDIDLTPESYYWWYIGDGNSTINGLRIVTGIKNPDVLIDKMPVKAMWQEVNGFPAVCLQDPKEGAKFLDYIGPCRHESYAYKWKIYDFNHPT